MSKPRVLLCVVGEEELRASWHQRLSSHRAAEAQQRPLLFESSARQYQLLFRFGEGALAAGVVLLAWFGEPLSKVQRAILLLASRRAPPLYVLLCNVQEGSLSRRDQVARSLREELSTLGFQGDEALLFEDPGITPSPETLTRLLEALDAQDALLLPPREASPLPEKHPVKLLAAVLSALRLEVRPALYGRIEKSTTEALFAGPLGSQFGGMPYLEEGEPWPECELCFARNKTPASLRFLWQVEAPASGGLYTFYTCTDSTHSQGQPIITTRYYVSPSPQRRQGPRRELSLPFYNSGEGRAPFAVVSSEVLEAPALWRSQEELRALRKLLLTQLKPRQSRTEYEILCALLGVSPSWFLTADEALKVGGVTPIALACARCGRGLRSLAVVSARQALRLLWSLRALHFLVCACSPSVVYTRVERSRGLYEE